MGIKMTWKWHVTDASENMLLLSDLCMRSLVSLSCFSFISHEWCNLTSKYHHIICKKDTWITNLQAYFSVCSWWMDQEQSWGRGLLKKKRYNNSEIKFCFSLRAFYINWNSSSDGNKGMGIAVVAIGLFPLCFPLSTHCNRWKKLTTQPLSSESQY